MSRFSERIRKKLKQFIHTRTQSGPYRFLIRNWNEISDINLAIGVLDTQFFDSELVPQPLSVNQLRSILVLAPHQDDEVIGAGGTLLIAKKAGVKLHILFITDGRSKGPVSYGETPEAVIEIRNREAAMVGSHLGAQIHHLGINNSRPLPSVADLDRLSDIIKNLEPQVLLVPWLLDTPKHRLVNHLLWLAQQRHPLPNCEVWGYQVHNTLLPNGYVDITDVAEEKRKLLEYYVSQNENVMRYDHLAMGMAAWNCRFLPDYKGDSAARYVEVFSAFPLKAHLKLIESFYLTDLDVTYRGGIKAEGMKALHGVVMNMKKN